MNLLTSAVLSIGLIVLAPIAATAQKLPLGEISSYLNKLQTATGAFTQINDDGSISTGTIYIKRPGKVRFEYNPPESALVVAGSNTVVIFDKKSNQPAESYPLARTPLSIIRLQTERLIGHPELPDEERINALDEQMEEIERLNQMIDDLLFLAKADAGVIPLSARSINLREYLADFKTDADLLAGEAGMEFIMECDLSQAWQLDPSLIRQVLLNLLSNALEVSKPGGVVQLSVSIEGDLLSLKMKDEGVGLGESQIERMFNRFERLGASSESKGNGLGLAICRSIVERHGGTICAYNRQTVSGLVVEVRLPGHM